MITLNHIPFMLWPLVLIVSVIDMYLFLTTLRLLLGCFKNAKADRFRTMLQPVTDSIPNGINSVLTSRIARFVVVKTCWIITLGGLLLLRYLILLLLTRSSQ